MTSVVAEWKSPQRPLYLPTTHLGCFDNKRKPRIEPTDITEVRRSGNNLRRGEHKCKDRSIVGPGAHGYRWGRQSR